MKAKVLLFVVLSYLSNIVTWLLSPLIAIFYYTEERTDVVKRYNKQVVTMPRQYIVKWLRWFTTDDNAADEHFWGYYEASSKWTIEEYQNSKWIQYVCRIYWLCRNPAYVFNRDILGFNRLPGCVKYVTQITVFGKPFEKTTWVNTDGSYAFLYVGGFGYKPLDNIRFGWKEHKKINKLMFADRILSLREK